MEANDIFFALDIGTHSVIGMLAKKNGTKAEIIAIEEETYDSRAMIDGQIEDIEVVARSASRVKERLETTINDKLKLVSVAAAGRTLRTISASYKVEYEENRIMNSDEISKINTNAVARAEESFAESLKSIGEDDSGFYLAGYSIVEYKLDGYPMAKLLDHQGRVVEATAIATFLPREVVESLYSAMRKIDLDIATLTLEPIAAMNAVIPADIRLLNLALVDIGAGTSDIAISKDGSIIGYTMATIAGDEISEHIMKKLLIDFSVAESLKMELCKNPRELEYTDILGLPHNIKYDELMEIIEEPSKELAKRIAEGIKEINTQAPSAVFMVGGGSMLPNLCELVAGLLDMDKTRVAIGGNSFAKSAFSNKYDLNNPYYATPLGIILTSIFDLNNEGFNITLNGRRCRLFRSDNVKVFDLLLMNGYHNNQLITKSAKPIVIYLNGVRKIYYPIAPIPAKITINGEEKSAISQVKAGDKVCFTPGVNGKEKEVYVSELVSEANGISIIYDDKEYVAGDIVRVDDDIYLKNSAELKGYKLSNLQRIKTLSIKSIADFVKYYDISEELCDGNDGSCDRFLYDGMILKRSSVSMNEAINDTGNKEKYIKINEDNYEDEAIIKDNKDKVEEKSEENAVINNQINSNVNIKSDSENIKKEDSIVNTNDTQSDETKFSKYINIFVNEKKIELPVKSGKESYMVCDLLSYTGFDLEKPKSGVKMNINGYEAGFTSFVKDNDRVEISWDKEN